MMELWIATRFARVRWNGGHWYRVIVFDVRLMDAVVFLCTVYSVLMAPDPLVYE